MIPVGQKVGTLVTEPDNSIRILLEEKRRILNNGHDFLREFVNIRNRIWHGD